ncbi:MAG: hypothetical protein ACK44E_03525 [Anaerolineales bacterium]
MKIIFLFLDGVGLGEPTSQNPFLLAETPFLDSLLQGQKLCKGIHAFQNEVVSVYELDARVGVQGVPQSATGQAMLLTGTNIPQQLGYHYGPKPNATIARFLTNGNLFRALRERQYRISYLNAFPPLYFENIASGRRLYSAIPLAAVSAGIQLNSHEDLVAGRALSADFTGEGWHSHLGFCDVPILTPKEAGQRIAEIAQGFDLTFFECWMTDYAGHHQNMAEAIRLLELIDRVLEGIATNWDFSEDMLWVTSDHGNIEDLSHRRHTLNPVPLLLIGSHPTRKELPAFWSLLDIYPSLLRLLPEKE